MIVTPETVQEIYKFVPVSDDFATAGQPTEEQLKYLAQCGYAAVVNLGLLDTAYSLPDEAGLVKSLGIEYHHIPVDFQAPALDDVERFCQVMDALRGKKIFVHCAANKRVSVFVALYGEFRLAWSRTQAQALITRVWEPNAVWAQFLETSRKVLRLD